MSFSVTMPALGESVSEGTVTRWLKNEGDVVAVDEPLLEVSTDKVDTEIPSPVAGILLAIDVAVDTTVPVGARLGLIGVQGGLPAPVVAAPVAPAPVVAAPAPVAAPVVTPVAATPVTLTSKLAVDVLTVIIASHALAPAVWPQPDRHLGHSESDCEPPGAAVPRLPEFAVHRQAIANAPAQGHCHFHKAASFH